MRLARLGPALWVACFLLLTACAGAQADAAAKHLQWDVISVKPMGPVSCPGNRGGVGILPDGMTATCVPVAFVVENAYRIMDASRIVGLPQWAKDDSHVYAIEARVGSGDVEAFQKLSRDEKFGMMQRVLADRFQMKAHMETRERPAYDLVVAKGGPKLRVAASDRPGNSQFGAPDGDVRWSNSALTNLTFLLGRETGRPVVDKTGLTGKYDFRLKFAPAARADKEDGDRVSIFTALEEQLGLKLAPAKEPVDVLVIDAIEQPMAN